jgi:hypothetical protein
MTRERVLTERKAPTVQGMEGFTEQTKRPRWSFFPFEQLRFRIDPGILDPDATVTPKQECRDVEMMHSATDRRKGGDELV